MRCLAGDSRLEKPKSWARPPRPPSCWQPCQRSRTQAALHQRCQIPDSVNGPERIAARRAACLFLKEGTKPTWAPRLSSCWNARRAVAFAQKGFEKGTDRTHFLFMRCSHWASCQASSCGLETCSSQADCVDPSLRSAMVLACLLFWFHYHWPIASRQS